MAGRVLSGRERTADIEKLEEEYYNSRRQFFELQTRYIGGHSEVSGREQVSFANDKLILETLISAKAAPGFDGELDNIRSDFEMLTSGKRKIAQLRALVEERDQAIQSIQKQLKPNRAAHLEDEVVKLQKLVKMAKSEFDYNSSEKQLAGTRRLYLQMHRVHQDIQTVEGHLTNIFIKQKRMSAVKQTKKLHMKNHQREIATLEAKLQEIISKEELAKQKFEKHLKDVESLMEGIRAESATLSQVLEEERERELLELKKLTNPPTSDENRLYISAHARKPNCFKWAKGDIKSILLGFKHDPRGFLGRLEIVGSEPRPGSFSAMLEEKTGTPGTRDRFLQTLQAHAPFLVNDAGDVKPLDLEVALQYLSDDPVHADALQASCNVLRERCIEKRVSEKTVKDVLLRFTPAQIGSFLVKLGLEPIHIDLVLQVLKCFAKATQCHVIGSSIIARHLEGWQTSTVQEDIQLCDFFLTGQKRSIYASSLREFTQKIDRPQQFSVHNCNVGVESRISKQKPDEIEHLFWLFAEPKTKVVDLQLPFASIRNNLPLLSQLTHGKL